MKSNLYTHANHQDKNLLILCEFLEGALESIRFSIRHLIGHRQKLVFVQAFQKPHFGQPLLNDFTCVMEQFANKELLQLKQKTIQTFNLDEEQITLCPFEGNWRSFMQYKQAAFNPGLAIFSLKDAFPGAGSSMSRKARKLAVKAKSPMLFLPEKIKQGPFQKVLYLADAENLSPEKIQVIAQFPILDKKASVELHVIGAKTTADIAEAVRVFSGACPFPVLWSGNRTSQGQLKWLASPAASDLVVIDQKLTTSFTLRKEISLKNWFGNKSELPVFIL
ncbi:MAG: hypothetical protein AB7U05_08405 [Mangrovibacterium sp.]